jgi:hypothetical protein
VGWVEFNAEAMLLTGELAIHADDAPGVADLIVLVFRDGLLGEAPTTAPSKRR